MREISNTSFEQGLLKTYNWSWSCLSYSFITASLILSIIVFVVTLLLDDLDILRQFVLLAQVNYLSQFFLTNPSSLGIFSSPSPIVSSIISFQLAKNLYPRNLYYVISSCFEHLLINQIETSFWALAFSSA